MLRLAVRVRREHAELVLAELLELAPSGVEEVELDGLVEYAVYGAPGELPTLPDLTAAAAGALVEVSTRELAEDWSERWREFHRPLVLDGRLTVRPPWEPPRGTPVELVIDPGRAFGTGAHATTRLCLELMLELPPGGGFVDLGCGSGVLAIAAAKLGWAPVIALDNDSAAVDAARANAAANGVALDVRRADLRREAVPDAPTIAANLLAPLLLAWAPRVPGAVRRLIASGLLTAEADRVAAAFADGGLVEADRRGRGEWTALSLERVGDGLDLGRVLPRRSGG
jgi:ribosomal protein L11 methyltransferase